MWKFKKKLNMPQFFIIIFYVRFSPKFSILKVSFHPQVKQQKASHIFQSCSKIFKASTFSSTDYEHKTHTLT